MSITDLQICRRLVSELLKEKLNARQAIDALRDAYKQTGVYSHDVHHPTLPTGDTGQTPFTQALNKLKDHYKHNQILYRKNIEHYNNIRGKEVYTPLNVGQIHLYTRETAADILSPLLQMAKLRGKTRLNIRTHETSNTEQLRVQRWGHENNHGVTLHPGSDIEIYVEPTLYYRLPKEFHTLLYLQERYHFIFKARDVGKTQSVKLIMPEASNDTKIWQCEAIRVKPSVRKLVGVSLYIVANELGAGIGQSFKDARKSWRDNISPKLDLALHEQDHYEF